MIRGLIVIGAAVLLAAAAACGGDEDSSQPAATATPEAAEQTPTAEVLQELIDAVNAFIAAGGIDALGVTPDRELLRLEDCKNPGDLCLSPDPPTNVSDTAATIGMYTNQSDAGWEVKLRNSYHDGQWTVVGVEYTGCC